MKRPKLAPAEWVLFAFVLVMLARMATLGTWALRVKAFSRDDVVAAALFVGMIKLAVESRRRAFPDATQATRFRLLLLLFVAPFLLVLVLRPDLFPKAPPEGGTLIPIVLTAHSWLRTCLLALLPPLLFYFATELHVKKHGALTTHVLLGEMITVGLRELRDWAPPLALMFGYGLFATVQEHPWFADQDDTLAHLDRVLFFGHDPVASLERIIWTPLSEWLSACYTFYLFLFPLVLGAAYAHPARERFREVAFATSFALAVGYVGYTLVPARGPLFTTTFSVSLDLHYVGWIKDQLMDKVRVPRDCFPSLHTCMSCVLLWGAWRNARWLFWPLAPIVTAIPFACVYLRYHYVVDVIAGMALFGVTTVVTKYLSRHRAFDDEDESSRRSPPVRLSRPHERRGGPAIAVTR